LVLAVLVDRGELQPGARQGDRLLWHHALPGDVRSAVIADEDGIALLLQTGGQVRTVARGIEHVSHRILRFEVWFEIEAQP
jgi:hypothetical protein